MARTNINQPPSNSDWEDVGRMTYQQKAQILYLYLYSNLTMSPVAIEVFGRDGQTESNYVSTVMRCYGFSGRNSGYFSKKLAYNLDYNDFYDFVRMYPDGTRGDWPDHNTIDKFMRERHNQKLNPYVQPNITQYPAVSMPADGYYQQNSWNIPENNFKQPNNWNNSVAQIRENNRKQLAEKVNKTTSADTNSSDKELIGMIGAVIFTIIIFVAIVKYVIDHVSFLSFFASVAGLFGVAGLVCCLGAFILFIIGLVTNKMRKLLKVILPMAAIGFLLASIADGNFGGVLISGVVALFGYGIGDALYKK